MKSRISSRVLALGMALLMIFSLLGASFVPAGHALAEASADDYQNASVADVVYGGGVTAASASQPITVKQAADAAAQYIQAKGVTSDWQAVALARGSYTVPPSYQIALEQQVKEAKGTFANATDYARISLAVTALGIDATGFAGYNLIEPIYNSGKLDDKPVNFYIYSLLALDAGQYSVPENALWTKDRLINKIVSQQQSDGGFTYGGSSDPDLTAMALTALGAHMDKPEVKSAGDRAVAWLKTNQQPHGGYNSWGSDSSESVAQAIIALTSAGIDPAGSDFTKADGVNLVSKLLSFRTADGGFVHELPGNANDFATYQALQALVAYNLYSGGSGTGFYVFPKPAPQPSTAHVSIAIEGPEAPIADGTVYASNVLDALKRLAVAKNIPLSVSSNDYVTSIQGISAGKYGSYDGWMYAVIRNGQYADANTGMAGFALKDSDQVLIYYTGSDTGLIDSVTFSPVNPKPGESFSATVNKKAWANVNGNYELVTAPAGKVQINIGGETVSTDNQGVASFSNKAVQSSGTYTVTITGYQNGAAPSIVRAKTILYAGGEKAPAVHAAAAVEGPQGPIAEGEVQGSTALEALENIAWLKDLSTTVTGSTYGNYVSAIEGIGAGTYGGWDGWNYAVKREGQWISPSVGVGAFPLLQGDQVVFYYGDFGTQLVSSVTVSKPQLEAGEAFKVTVRKIGWNYDPVTYEPTPVISAAVGVQVAAGGQTAETNAEGVASFNGLSAGYYTITVTGYQNNTVPSIVRYTQPLTVSVSTQPDLPAVSKATLSVVGDSVKGTILSSTSVALSAGDSPYSLLQRALGGKVESRTSSGGVYVYSIDGLAEFDRGGESGWKYFVNGNEPPFSADKYVLKDGDDVLWKYVTSSTETSAGGAPGAGAPAISGVSITSANTLPLNQVGATTAVSGTPMTSQKSAELAKTLTANSVSFAQLATSAGAALKDAAGEVQLQIPAGAVEGIAITIGVQEQLSSRPELVSGLYEFTPNGTKFAKPTDLSIQIPVGTRNPQNLALAWLDEKTNQWIPVPAVLDLSTGTITGKVSHFTKYAVVDRSKWEASGSQVKADISAAAKWILSAGELSDWQAFGLVRSGNALPSGYLDSVLKQIAESKGEFRKVTDYERLALSIAAAGGDPRNAADYDLIAKIYNNGNLTNQGSNGPIFALLALDSGNYSVPASAVWTRAKLVKWITDIQNTDGGFPLMDNRENNVDLTAMAVAALSAHKEENGVQAAIDKAVAWLSGQQLEDGGYKLSGEENSESVSQVIIALSTADIGPGDARFVKAKGSLLSNLATFKRSDGGYAHTVNGATSGLATEQALLALTAYDLYLNGQGKLYRLADAPAAAPVVFADEKQISAWALSSVHEAYDQKLMEGVGGAKPAFAPKSAITRAQLAVLLVRLTGNVPGAASAVSGFGDVKAESWYYGYVMKAKELGIIGGVTATSFKPNQPVSRQDMAVMIARAYKLSPSSKASFKDGAAIGSYAIDAVNAVTEKGYMTGFGGSFDPSGAVTREMAAVVAVRLP